MSGKGKDGRGKATAKATRKLAKTGLQFPVARVDRYLMKGKYATRVGAGATESSSAPRSSSSWAMRIAIFRSKIIAKISLGLTL